MNIVFKKINRLFQYSYIFIIQVFYVAIPVLLKIIRVNLFFKLFVVLAVTVWYLILKRKQYREYAILPRIFWLDNIFMIFGIALLYFFELYVYSDANTVTVNFIVYIIALLFYVPSCIRIDDIKKTEKQKSLANSVK